MFWPLCAQTVRQTRKVLEQGKKKDLTTDSGFGILQVKDERGIMKTLTELKTFDAVLRMSRFSTKRKGNDKKRISKKLCRKKVRF